MPLLYYIVLYVPSQTSRISHPLSHISTTTKGYIDMSARVHRTTTRTRDSRGKFASTIPQGLRICDRCRSTHTSQWRTGIDGSSLCNKCGIKLKRESDRLLELSHVNSRKSSSRPTTSSRIERPSKRGGAIAVSNLLNPLPFPESNQEIVQYQQYYNYQHHHHNHNHNHSHDLN